MDKTLPRKINIGCGYQKYEDFLNVDVDPAAEPDFLLIDGDFSGLPQNYFSYMLANDVLEHIPRDQTMPSLLSWASLLCHEGVIDIQTSSIFGVVDSMRATPGFTNEFNWTTCLFGNQKHPGDFHHTGFTENTLRVFLAAAGFDVGTISLREGWLFSTSATKTIAWDNLLDNEFDDEEFLKAAYLNCFYRELDNVGQIVWMDSLSKGLTRRDLLFKLNCTPERLYRTAEKMGL